jgi:hypothetical protein
MKRWTTSDILSSAHLRRRGYADAFFAAARRDGPYWVLDARQFSELRERYAPIAGLGDLLWLFLHPLARWIDRRFQTRLSSCAACSRRRAWLNRLLPAWE